MGKRYEYYVHHKSSYFLPMLCSKASIKDVKIPKWENHSSSSSCSSSGDDPLSPKIGCMGQIKRSNRINTYPELHKLSITTGKYFKLKKMFSGKNLTAGATPVNSKTSVSGAGVVAANERSIVCRRQRSMDGGRRWQEIRDLGFVDIGEMDPPLPVVKKLKEEGGEMGTLWKRRFGGAELKTLQLQEIQFPRNQLQATTV